MFQLNRIVKPFLVLGLAGICCLLLFPAGSAQAEVNSTDRAAWLLQRDSLETLALTGERFEQGEIGGGGAGTMTEDKEYAASGKGPSAGLTILASAILPGAGEALMGYTRGYFMMAADIASWTQVVRYHNEGKDVTDLYYDYADEHYSDELLVEGYNGASEDQQRQGEGAIYFPGITENIATVEDLHLLPLYVTVEEDRREYYENLGKWDQFIFGWDDYLRASAEQPQYNYEPTMTISDLRTAWVSKHRDYYRDLRAGANSAYKTRDRYMYFNMGLRVFSVLEVAGHTIEIITEPQGLSRGTLAARVSF